VSHSVGKGFRRNKFGECVDVDRRMRRNGSAINRDFSVGKRVSVLDSSVVEIGVIESPFRLFFCRLLGDSCCS
jgi:hypothetical protein